MTLLAENMRLEDDDEVIKCVACLRVLGLVDYLQYVELKVFLSRGLISCKTER